MPVSDIASVATAIAVIVAAVSLLFQVNQRKMTLAQMYVERYWQIDDAFTEAKEAGASLEIHQERYLRLCEDEYEIARLGWVTHSVWQVWHEGIVANLDPQTIPSARYRFLRQCFDRHDGHTGHQCPAIESVPKWRQLYRRLTAG